MTGASFSGILCLYENNDKITGMIGIDFDALVNLVFQGRALMEVADLFNSFVCMGWLLLVFTAIAVCVCGMADVLDDVIRNFKGAIVGFVGFFLMIVIVGMCGRCYFSYKASLLPKMDDAKLIVTYKVGEEVVKSPDFKRLVEAATKKLEESSK